jgi:hypothetical protein
MSSQIGTPPATPDKRVLGRRLITQNMLTSARYFENQAALDYASVEDLSTFIDMFCLYEKAIVLGRAGNDVNNISSDFFGLLKDTQFIDIQLPSDDIAEAVTNSAVNHLATFLKEEDSERFQEVVRVAYNPNEACYALTSQPDRSEEIQIGKEWLLTTPDSSSLLTQLEQETYAARGTTFLVRTFLYLAYADVSKITLTPDTIRNSVLGAVLSKEDSYRAEILSKFKGQWENYPTRGEIELRRKVSPFAAIVFKRAGSKADIPEEMAKLRYETEALRRELHKIEDQALWWESRDEAVKAERKWNEILKEIEADFGPDPRFITIKRGLNFAGEVAGTVEKPYSPKSWIGLISGTAFDLVKRFIARGPAIEIHTLRSQLQAPDALKADIARLFGEVKDIS